MPVHLHPILPTFVMDDASVLEFIDANGGSEVHGKLPDPRTLSQTCLYTEAPHPTHWIIVMRFAGYDRPEDNGHALLALPKAHHTRRQANAAVLAFFKEHAIPGDPQGPFVQLDL